MQTDVTEAFAKTSLRGRLAAGLWCFERYCRKNGRLVAEVEEYLTWMWKFIYLGTTKEEFQQWINRSPDLVQAGLGYEMPGGVLSCFQTGQISLKEFNTLLCSVTEILYSSLYSRPQNEESLRFLTETIEQCRPYSIWPPAEVFATSPWADHGWGFPLTQQQAMEWRAATGS